MKISVNRRDLLAACTVAASAAAGRTTNPVLKYTHFSAAGQGDLFLWATDLESGVRRRVAGATVFEAGQSCMDASRLASILKEVESTDVDLSVDGSRCKVLAGFDEFELPVLSAGDFPPCPVPKSEPFTVDAGELATMLARVLFAVGADSTKYALTAVCWQLEGGKLVLVGTDTRRLSVSTYPGTLEGLPDAVALVPAEACRKLERLISDKEEVKVWLGKSEAFFGVEDDMVYTRLVEGRYPPYARVLPKSHKAEVDLPVDAFMGVARKAKIMEDVEMQRATFDFSEKDLTVTCQGPTTGKVKAVMPLAEHKAVGLSFDLTPRQVVDLARSAGEGNTLRLEATDAEKPIAFKMDNFVHVMFPLQTRA